MWQPIETAPKDGQIILLYRPDAKVGWMVVTPGKWNPQPFAKKPRPYWECWLKIGGDYESRTWPPTHWMPLPNPPEPTANVGTHENHVGTHEK